jgi:hypothetical protein
MTRITTVVRRGAIAFLDRHLQGRTKRLIFLASLSARLKDSSKLDHDTMKKLNTLMDLCKDESAIKLPVELSKVIWHGKASYEICRDQVSSLSSLSSDRINLISTRVLTAMPAWLRYGNDDEMQKDVAKLLTCRTAVLGI